MIFFYGKLKHITKPDSVKLRQRDELILVDLEDSRVLRTVLPFFESHSRFWEYWNELKVGSLWVNAYTPPFKRLELPYSPLSRKMQVQWQ